MHWAGERAHGSMTRPQDSCEFASVCSEPEECMHQITEGHAIVSGFHPEDCGGHGWIL